MAGLHEEREAEAHGPEHVGFYETLRIEAPVGPAVADREAGEPHKAERDHEPAVYEPVRPPRRVRDQERRGSPEIEAPGGIVLHVVQRR